MPEPSRTSAGLTAGRVITIVLVALLIVFCLLNSQSVRMHWILTTTTQPLFVILLVFAAIGAGIGFFLGRRNSRS